MLASGMYSGCMALRDRTRSDNITESYDKKLLPSSFTGLAIDELQQTLGKAMMEKETESQENSSK
jgi:hypothetical protein